ncbi:class I adenylate-forming enzyme family protein [Shimia haliotis]|uniref:Long-chain acyl-CoA synthetase n=1 Tax=Shimia haliotis TaxID=1280847 RepID=A0A1I4G0G1_9RHOB|nr:AMP-binding protein [Shimia haliotis]SFL23514.1 long-chain acyl-CoA synthetase [Shimia haliotis]
MNIALWLQRAAGLDPKRQAIFSGTKCVETYGSFLSRIFGVANWLAQQGVSPGDRVGLFLKNCPDYLVALHGIWAAGAVAVPMNAKLHPKEAAWILQDAGARLCFATGGLAEAVTTASNVQCEAVPVCHGAGDIAPRKPEDLCWLFYTSGTTGRPKGVMITHRMIAAMATSYFVDVDEVTAADTALYAAPMSHGAGLYNVMHVLKGARHVVPQSGSFDEAEIFDLAAHFGRVHMFAAPTMVKRMTQVAKEIGSTGAGLRTVVYGGGPMYVEDIREAVDHFGPVFAQIYGQGECPMCITALTKKDVARGDAAKLASVGRAQSVVELAIGVPEGVLPAGEVGEILVRGDAVMPGYWRNDAATAATLKDGWLLTGDMGALDTAGYLTLKDRSKDLIISGGTNIYPREVEEVLLTHPSVREVSVVGRPHPEWGEDVVAFVVCDGALNVAALEAHCLAEMARFKRPKDYVQVESLPKNNYGKVLKTELRLRLSE